MHPFSGVPFLGMSGKQANQSVSIRALFKVNHILDVRRSFCTQQQAMQLRCKTSEGLRVWEDEVVHIKGSYCLLSILSQVPSWADFHWAWERVATLEALCFMLWACPCQTPLFGMPFYISTPIFKASFLLPSAAHALILIPLQWDGSSKSL